VAGDYSIVTHRWRLFQRAAAGLHRSFL